MKAIKITAIDDSGNVNTRALEVAECLRGSDTANESLFIGASGGVLVVEVREDSYLEWKSEITLSLDSLKVCPFMCMKHQLSVKVHLDGFSSEYFKISNVKYLPDGKFNVIWYANGGGCNSATVESIQIDPTQFKDIEGIEEVEL